MNLQELQKAHGLFNQIIEIQEHILNLNTFAQNVAKGGQAHFDMRVEVAPDKALTVLNEEGFLRSNASRGNYPSYEELRSQTWKSIFGASSAPPGITFELSAPDKAPSGRTICGDVSQTISLRIIDLILKDLEIKKNKLLYKLEQLGIKINE